MSDGITDAQRESQEAYDDWRRREIKTFLSMRTTEEPVDELRLHRKGVDYYQVHDDGMYSLHVMSKGHDHMATNNGKYLILVVKE
jgi:serine phosphatase RsbU (regulator of sigma subunit)